MEAFVGAGGSIARGRGGRPGICLTRRLSSRGMRVTVPMATVASNPKTTPKFITEEIASRVISEVGSPTFVYDLKSLLEQAEKALAFRNAYGLTVRYAMKACPNAAILTIFNGMGLAFDASSVYECQRLLLAGVPSEKVCLSSQELGDQFVGLVNKGVEINCCSLSQMRKYGQAFPNTEVGVRFNPGLGSGGTGKTNVGGTSASFGIWHELMNDVKSIAEEYGLKIIRIHTHIGSGSDPAVWARVVGLTLNLAKQLPDVTTVDLGGGYKVGRMPGEVSTDLDIISAPVKEAFEQFAEETGRKLHLEIEPGTFLVANAGAILCTAQDIVSTGAAGHEFIKLDIGMTEVLRPSLYGAQHPITILPKDSRRESEDASYVVVGHCCESGDLFTPASGDPEVGFVAPVHNLAERGCINLYDHFLTCSSPVSSTKMFLDHHGEVDEQSTDWRLRRNGWSRSLLRIHERQKLQLVP